MRQKTLYVETNMVLEHLEPFVSKVLDEGEEIDTLWVLFAQLILYGICFTEEHMLGFEQNILEHAELMLNDLLETGDYHDEDVTRGIPGYWLTENDLIELVSTNMVRLAITLAPYVRAVLDDIDERYEELIEINGMCYKDSFVLHFQTQRVQ